MLSGLEREAIEYWQYIRDTQIYDGYKGQVYAVTLLNLTKKQKKEIDELKEKNENLSDALNNSINIKKYWVNKDKIKEILGIEEETDTEEILSLLQTIVSENSRLEDIEDRKVQIEYNNVFNKGVKSVEDKIKAKIEEQDETKQYWTDEVKDILKSLLRKEQ